MNSSLGQELLYLSHSDVVSAGLGMAEIIAALEGMFREKAEGRVEMPPKIGIHTMPDAFIHAMPASIPAQKAAGMKWVGGYPDNSKRGLPYITGLLILNDPETGVPWRSWIARGSPPSAPALPRRLPQDIWRGPSRALSGSSGAECRGAAIWKRCKFFSR